MAISSHLKRLPDYDTDKCDCNNQSSQSPAHLLLSCNKYQIEREGMREKLQIDSLSLKILLNTKPGIQSVFEFLEKPKLQEGIGCQIDQFHRLKSHFSYIQSSHIIKLFS